MKKTILVSLFVCLVSALTGHAQTQIAKGAEQVEILKIAEMYRNAPNLAFNFTYTYADSAHADSVLETSTGFCKISDGRYYTYTSDSTEYIQGYQYSVVVSHNDSSVVVNNRQEYGDFVKGIPVIDTLLYNQYVDSIKVFTYDDVPTNDFVIYFSANAPYSKYILTYDRTSFRITNILFYIKNAETDDGIITARINFSMSSYSTSTISQDLFLEDKFIYKQGGQLHLKPGYTGYQLLDYTTE
jgi:hypothetical protein